MHEARQHLAEGASKSSQADAAARAKLEQDRRKLDDKIAQLEEKERVLADADQKLKKRKEKLDQLEAQHKVRFH